MAQDRLPSIDLVLATVERVDELDRFLESLEAQTHRAFRVLVVDQNGDARVSGVLHRHPTLKVSHLKAPRGLSRARNAALAGLRGDIVAFPDDDCVYTPDLLRRVARRFAEDAAFDGLTGRAVDPHGRSIASWARDATQLTRDNLWNRAISFTIFLRRSLVDRVGPFDEQLGLGASGPWCSGEETDYLVRTLDAGARVVYDPALVVVHDEKQLSPSALRSIGARDGASIGYILRKHRYPLRTVVRMFARPLGGALMAAARRDGSRVRFHLSTFKGRLLGYGS